MAPGYKEGEPVKDGPNTGHHLAAESSNKSDPMGEVILRWQVRCLAVLEGIC